MPPGAACLDFRGDCLGGMVGSEKKAPATEADGREVEYSLLR